MYPEQEWDDDNWDEMCAQLGADPDYGLGLGHFVAFQRMMNDHSESDADTDTEIDTGDRGGRLAAAPVAMQQPPAAVNVDLAAKFASGSQSSRASSTTDVMQRAHGEHAEARAKGAKQVRDLTAMTVTPTASPSGAQIPRATRGGGKWKQKGSARSAAAAAAVVSDDSDTDEDDFQQGQQAQQEPQPQPPRRGAGPTAPTASANTPPGTPARDAPPTAGANRGRGPALPARDASPPANRGRRPTLPARDMSPPAGANRGGPPLPARDAPPAGIFSPGVGEEEERSAAEEAKALADEMEDAGAIENEEAYRRAKQAFAQGSWNQAMELFADAVDGEGEI